MNLRKNVLLSVPLINLITSFSFYLPAPLLPIYFVESLEKGGLGWSRVTTYSIYGTFLSALYIVPFLAGLLGNSLLKGKRMDFSGYIGALCGMIGLLLYQSPYAILASLLVLSVGIGCIKVRLSTILGSIPKESRSRGFDFLYNASCLGFVLGAVTSSFIFERFFMKAVLSCSLCGVLISALVNYFFLSEFRKQKIDTAVFSEKPTAPISDRIFFGSLLLLGTLFFSCFNQMITSLPIFIHQNMNRTVGNFVIPTLWFGATASLTITVISPFIRKIWQKFQLPSKNLFLLKPSFAFLILACGFFTLTSLSQLDVSTLSAIYNIALIIPIHILFYVADFHLRPTLLLSATQLVPQKWHPVTTGLVYVGIGLGGKFASSYAAYADTIGFSWIFSTCCTTCLCTSVSLFVVYSFYRRKAKVASESV